MRRTAAAIAQLDVLVNFARIAASRNYSRPEFTSGTAEGERSAKAGSKMGSLLIAGGRHPVIEKLLEERGERFVPNDLYLDDETQFLLIITGPNMGGKSTYLRQAALISILAQMGSFVPAVEARLPVLDRVFTRIGASDNLARGRSTFLVEMSEVAAILNTATSASLVLLDEVGRGTSTFDGLSIAWAVVEALHAGARPKTLFATHYHELTELEQLLPGVKNVHVAVQEAGREIVFLRRVEPGSADKSYGIEVARLAGLPNPVIRRAREILKRHEESEEKLTEQLSPGAAPPSAQQVSFAAIDENGARIAARGGCERADAARGFESAGGIAEATEMRAVSERAMRVLGMMSGTSADGIDVVLARISGAPPAITAKFEEHFHVRFPAAVRDAILRLANGATTTTAEISQLEFFSRRRVCAGGNRRVQTMARTAAADFADRVAWADDFSSGRAGGVSRKARCFDAPDWRTEHHCGANRSDDDCGFPPSGYGCWGTGGAACALC